MKKIVHLILLVLFSLNIQAQKNVADANSLVSSGNTKIKTNTLNTQLWELGESFGSASYMGDLLKANYTLIPCGISGGLFTRINIKDRMAVKTFVNILHLEGSDKSSGSKDLYHYRNLSFRNNLKEVGTQFEMNLFRFDDYNVYNDDSKKYYNLTPYVFGGAAVVFHNPQGFHKKTNEWVDLQPLTTEGVKYNRTIAVLPFGYGFKWKINPHTTFHVEFGHRLTFTDYLDDVSDKYPDFAKLLADKGQIAVDMSWGADEKNSKPKLNLPQGGQGRGDKKDNDFYSQVQFGFSSTFQYLGALIHR